MTENNFKRWEENNLRQFPQAPPRVKKDLDGSMGFIRMISKVIEVYLPNVFNMFVIMGGGDNEKDQHPKPPSEGGTGDFGDPKGPSGH